MKTTFMFIVLIAVLLLPGGLWLESEDTKPLKQFETLVGEWENVSNGTTYTETWKLGPCGNLEGSASVKDPQGKLLLTETLEIREIGPHTVYIACVNNSPPVLFTLKEVTLKDEDNPHAGVVQWIFENPEHDFPQRIVYRLEPGDILYAYVEGIQKGAFTKEEFRLKRKLP